MASFASEVKSELSRKFYEKKCCQRAELTALLRLSGAVFMDKDKRFGIKFAAKNAAVTRKTLIAVKAENPLIKTRVYKSKSKKLKKYTSYNLTILPTEEGEKLLASLGFGLGFSVDGENRSLKKSCCKSAYLRGAFLAIGSVNKPESEYHLEFKTVSESFAKFLLELLKKLNFPAKITERKDEYIVYLKEGEAILDFLYMTEAIASAEKFEAARNLKEVRSQVNRIVNCETANLEKTVAASLRQTEYINALKRAGVLSELKTELQDTARVRLEHPEESLSELAAILHISKSALTHRMKKLKLLAENL